MDRVLLKYQKTFFELTGVKYDDTELVEIAKVLRELVEFGFKVLHEEQRKLPARGVKKRDFEELAYLK